MPKFTVKEMKATRTGFGEALVERFGELALLLLQPGLGGSALRSD